MPSRLRLINLSTVSLLVGNLLMEETGFVRHLVGLYGAAFSGMFHFYSLLVQLHHLSTWTRKGQRGFVSLSHHMVSRKSRSEFINSGPLILWLSLHSTGVGKEDR